LLSAIALRVRVGVTVSKLQRFGRESQWTVVPVKMLVAVAALGLTVAACGISSSQEGGPSSEAQLPGIKEFGLTEEQFVVRVEKVESTIAKCMAAAGFEYIPVDVSTIERAQQYVRADPNVSREDYHRRWGYGETTRFDDPVRRVGLGPQNRRIFNSLPESDQVAYNRTLFGENPDMTFAWTLDEEDFSETGGCTRKGAAAAFTPKQMAGTYENPKDVLVESDERIVKAVDAWVECMREAGYEGYRDQDEIMEELGERLDELLDGDSPGSLTGARAAALKRLQAEEVAASMADLACEIKHTDDVYRQVETEVFGQPLN
jgi:hypothetical protein